LHYNSQEDLEGTGTEPTYPVGVTSHENTAENEENN